MKNLDLRRSVPTIAVAAALVALSATSGATAALMITGKDIKDGTVTTKDVKNGSLTQQDLSGATSDALRGDTGPWGQRVAGRHRPARSPRHSEQRQRYGVLPGGQARARRRGRGAERVPGCAPGRLEAHAGHA